MNRYLVIICLLFNVALMVLFWRNWRSVKEIKDHVHHPNVFVPTNEWQRIDRDQPIPAGLHVRINLETGEREAKLLSSEENDETSIVMVEEDVINEGSSSSKNLKYDLLKDSLKNIPNEIVGLDSENDRNRVKKKFRSYEQLKKDMSKLHLQVKTDVEILNELIINFNKLFDGDKVIDSDKEVGMLSILKDLEYLLHQVDNAKEFSKVNGISDLIVPCLSTNSTLLRTAAARVLASATQNNAVVQIASLKAGVIPLLLKNIALQKDYEIRSSSIYALSCVIRGFPFSEIKLIEEGGLSVLLSIFGENSADALKLQLKVINFFNDLLVEREDAELIVEEEKLLSNVSDPSVKEEIKLMTEKLRQYDSVGLKSKLLERNWCSKLSDLLLTNISKKKVGSLIEENDVDHDVADSVLHAVLAVSAECEAEFEKEQVFSTVLKNLYDYYLLLSNSEERDSFYNDMYNLLDKLCTIKFRNIC